MLTVPAFKKKYKTLIIINITVNYNTTVMLIKQDCSLFPKNEKSTADNMKANDPLN